MNRQRITRIGLTALTLTALVLLIGCGKAISPLSPVGQPALAQKGSDVGSLGTSTRIVFSSRNQDPSQILRTTKPTGKTKTQKTSGRVTRKGGGLLSVLFGRGVSADDGAVNVLAAVFHVDRGAVDQDVTIDMAVTSGLTLEDVSVDFSPDGLKFSPPATLTITGMGPVDDGLLKAYHIEGSGSGASVSKLVVSLKTFGNFWVITIKVHGFSSYSLGDDQSPPEAGP